MLCVLSPAKSLDYETKPATKKFSEPRLLNETKGLIDALRPLTPADLQKMMGISAQLAELNVERFADFETPLTRPVARQAILAFAGDVYRGMDAPASFSERDFTHAQKTVRILSGLYGVLRPLDLMAPYRLEMGSKLKTDRGSNLYSYWGDQITDVLAADLAASPGADALVNLASNEYFSAVKPERLDTRLISPTFLDSNGTNDYRIVSFFAKQARGSMAGWMVKNRVKSVKALQDFDGMGYRYDPDRSSSNVPVFKRISPPPANS